MKAINVKEKTHNILFKQYSENILGYSAILNGCGHFFIINDTYKDNADEIYSRLVVLSKQNFRNFILLQKNGNVQATDNLNFLEKSDS